MPTKPQRALPMRSIPSGLAGQERERQKSLRRLASLRRKAAAEIDRLIAFLDASDVYVATELEADYSDFEPELGSHEVEPAGAVSYLPSWGPCGGLRRRGAVRR